MLGKPQTTTACRYDSLTDVDGDGYSFTDDCDDSNPLVYPDTEEICDGVDNNCDSVVDEGVLLFYIDEDGDGYGDSALSVEACEAPLGYVADSTDCDELKPHHLSWRR